MREQQLDPAAGAGAAVRVAPGAVPARVPDTGARPQLFNALKYSTAFPVILFSALKYQARSHPRPPILVG